MFEAVTRDRIRVTLILIGVVIIAVYAFEFHAYKRPRLDRAAIAANMQTQGAAAPVFGLANILFECAATHGFVTEVRVTGETASTTCGTGFTEATTRCPSGYPMIGFGEQIKCASGEAIRCAGGGPLQSLGLFKSDSYCGDASDRDMGPPGAPKRTTAD